jgi:hypothetical protein
MGPAVLTFHDYARNRRITADAQGDFVRTAQAHLVPLPDATSWRELRDWVAGQRAP